MKRIVATREKCELCNKRVAKYICIECDMIYCKQCAGENLYECVEHEVPELVEIVKGITVA